MRGPDGDVARYRQIVPPVLSTVLTFVIVPVADFAAAIRVSDLGCDFVGSTLTFDIE